MKEKEELINPKLYEPLITSRFYVSLKGENELSKTIDVSFDYWIEKISGLGSGNKNIVITCSLFKNSFITDLNKLISEYNRNNVLEVILLDKIGEIVEKIKFDIISNSISYSYNDLDVNSDDKIIMTINLTTKNVIVKEEITPETIKTKIIYHWKNAGMLDNLDEDKIEPIALAYERTAMILLQDKFMDIETIIFPIIRKVLTNITNKDYIFNGEKFLELASYYNSKPDSFFEETDKNYHEGDEELNKVIIIAELIIGEIDKP